MNEREASPYLQDAAPIAEPENKWKWRDCRSVGVSVGFWLWPWALGPYRDDDVFGGYAGFEIGPLDFRVSYNNGGREPTHE